MENEAAGSEGGPNTPSRLRQPKQRKSAFVTPLVAQQMAAAILERSASIPDVSQLDLAPSGDGDAEGGHESQRPRLKSPRLRAKEPPQAEAAQARQQKALPPSLPRAIPNGPAGGGDRLVTTYKSALSATGRPVLVTRMMPRSMSKSSVGSQKSTLPQIPQPPPYGGGVVYETGIRKGRLEEMERMMDELKRRMETSTQSSQGMQDRLDGALRTVATLEEERRSLQDQLARTVATLEEERRSLQDQLASKGRAADEAREEVARARRQFEAARAEWEGESAQSRCRMQAALDGANEERAELERRCKGQRSELSDCADEIAALKARISSQSSSLVESDAQIRALKAQVGLLEGTCADRSVQIGSVEAQLAEAREQLVVANGKLQAGEALRRKLHNTVQELKGNIRVFCRVRPLSAAEAAAAPNRESPMEHITIVSSEGGDSLEEIRLVQQVESSSGSVAKPSVFSFDKVFPGEASQGAVFDEISQLVQSALDGYRVCIFAYGQTGSGKTFTMEGDASDPIRKGMIPRAVEQIFDSTKLLGERGWAFSFEASYLEIYNETIRDLLAVKGPAAGAGGEPKYDIKHVDGSTHVTDQVVVPVSQPREIMTLLSRAASNRAVAETQCNERSSRSHSVFSLKITGENGVTGEKISGLLNLIDLAGSERLSQSGSTGDRLKETQAINKSLSSLGDVIHSLASKEAHIPYRNSKLTYLLQHSLGGNSKTLMFVNVSPAAANMGESICSLRFATKVNACHIGTATRKVGK